MAKVIVGKIKRALMNPATRNLSLWIGEHSGLIKEGWIRLNLDYQSTKDLQKHLGVKMKWFKITNACSELEGKKISIDIEK